MNFRDLVVAWAVAVASAMAVVAGIAAVFLFVRLCLYLVRL